MGKLQRDGDAFVAAPLPGDTCTSTARSMGESSCSERSSSTTALGLGLGVGEKPLGGAGVLAGELVAGEVFKPGRVFIFVERRAGSLARWAALFAAALPLVLREVDDDAVEVGGDGGVAAELGQRAVEAEEGFLREVFDVRAGAGHAGEGAEDKGPWCSRTRASKFSGDVRSLRT